MDYEGGALLNAVTEPDDETKKEWLEKGDWLALAKKAGAEKVFFVKNDPVLIFCKFQHIPDDRQLLEQFRRAWCLARPQMLFIASPGELRVYRLDQPPTMSIDVLRRDREINAVRRVAEVAEKLKGYRRELVESGRLAEEKYFGGIEQRADKRLIQDLKTLRLLLLRTGLDQKYVHALIGRSIFIRYLEDRGVLTSEYFEEIAHHNPEWRRYLSEDLERLDFGADNTKRWYVRVLHSKEFTYALFNQLAINFNGDLFPKDPNEEVEVDQKKHLEPLRRFLLGDPNTGQTTLFFWAYDFEIIPIELISSIYEEFYHKSNVFLSKESSTKDDKGTHYTTSVLVEYVLSRVLDEDRLSTYPKILDPACGSGIFLVEAFRRAIRYEVMKRPEHKLPPDDLRKILRQQIRGIEINEEAVRVAAFSLYLALLHYQEPPDIRARRLPHLIYNEGQPEDEDHYHVLFNKNTFALTDDEREQLGTKLYELNKYSGRDRDVMLYHTEAVLPLSLHSLDVIVGNPPWGFEKGTTQEIRDAQQQVKQWCECFDWSIGDKELSQAFIARSLSLLKVKGECGFLISTGVFFKHHDKSKRFRQRWLSEATIKTVVNFAHVRHAFFNADAPFAFVQFESGQPDSNHWINYWSAKRTQVVDKLQLVVLGQPDIRIVRQDDLQHNDFLWKVYWWGNHRDASLIKTLRLNTSLSELAKSREWPKPGRGYEDDFPTGDHNPSGWLQNYKALPAESFRRYGAIDLSDLKPVPEKVHRYGEQHIQSGWRLLIKRGISQANASYGRIEARLEDVSYCFPNSIHGLNVSEADDWERKVLIGIIWSSLARYYYFMTSSSWGTWHYEIHLEEAMSLPIRFPKEGKLRDEIVEVVNKLLNWPVQGFLDGDILQAVAPLEHRLDEAIFDLYKLNEPERDLIFDMCETNLEFFYQHSRGNAARSVRKFPISSQGVARDVLGHRYQEKGLEGYIYAFLEIWNQEMEPEGEFRWRIIRPSNSSMIAVVFSTQEKGDIPPPIGVTNDEDWNNVLDRCSDALAQPISRNIYIDAMVRVVTDTDIFIIKRDERRLWTRSMAREDAEAALLQAMNLQEAARV